MTSYKKILIFFKKLNIHRGFIKDFSKKKSPNHFIFSYRNQKFNFNLNKTLISLYTTLKLIQILKSKGSILFVGDFDNLFFFESFNKKKIQKFFFIQKWVHGILSNWEGFLGMSFDQHKKQKKFTKNSQKLRFFRFFL